MKRSAHARMRYLCFAVLIALGLFAFPGSTEIDAQVFAINIGIDRLTNGMVRVTVQMPSGEADGPSGSSPQQGSDSQSGGGGEDTQEPQAKQLEKAHAIQQQSRQSGYLISTADGINFADAISILTATLPRLLNMSQVKQVVFSEAFACDAEFAPLVESLINANEFYNAAELVVCEGSAEEFIREQNLILGARLSKAQDAAAYAHKLVGFVPSAHMADIYYAMHSGYGDGAAALCATNLFQALASSNALSSGTVYAGQVARTGANLNEYMGSALFGDSGMVGRLTGHETQLMNILRGTLSEMLYMDGQRTSELRQQARPRVTIDTSGSAPRISIYVELQMIPHLRSLSAEEVRARMTDELLALIVKCQALGVEPFGFGKVAVRSFPTFEAWNGYHWRDRFAQADIGLDVKVITVDT